MLNRKESSRDTKKTEMILKSRKVYRKPHLDELGDLRTLTLGGSAGTGDSGAGLTDLPFMGPILPPES